MNNPFMFFDGIYCINLDSQPERWEECKKQFEKVGITDRVKRFSRIKHADGYVGATMSHVEIVKIAKREGLRNVLILEDDVEFINDPIMTLNKSLAQLPRIWDVFFLGFCANGYSYLISENIVEAVLPSCVHAYAVNKSIYDKVINDAIPYGKVIDGYFMEKTGIEFKTYATYPLIATQNDKWNNHKGVKQDYSIEQRFNNSLIDSFSVLNKKKLIEISKNCKYETSSNLDGFPPLDSLFGISKKGYNGNTFSFHTKDELGSHIIIELDTEYTEVLLNIFNRKDCCKERSLNTKVWTSSDKINWEKEHDLIDTFDIKELKINKDKSFKYIKIGFDKDIKGILHFNFIKLYVNNPE